MTQETKHTPTPWDYGYQGGKYGKGELLITGDKGEEYSALVGQIHTIDPKEAEANAAFIVRACNAHDELVAALECAAESIEAFGAQAAKLPEQKEQLRKDMSVVLRALAKARREA